MNPATAPRDDRGRTRLLVVDPASGRRADALARDLPRWLGAGDLLIVNDAATLPASLRARAIRGQDVPGDSLDVEVRLTGINNKT